MKILVLMVTLCLSHNVWAITNGKFFGMQMVVNISSVTHDGTVDGSPQNLFLLMNRPEQDSFMGRGKVLEAPQNKLNFVCARRGENNYQCSIYIHQSDQGQAMPGKAQFLVTGKEASMYFKQFHPTLEVVEFVDESRTFFFKATREKFVINYDERGL